MGTLTVLVVLTVLGSSLSCIPPGGAFASKPVLSGYIRNPAGQGVPGVVLSATEGGEASVTTADGRFETRVPLSWSGSITPRRNGYVFKPSLRSFARVEKDTADNDFFATPDPAGSGQNASPVANAGPDQFVLDQDDDGAEDVTLDGSLSSDPDGQIVAHAWFQDGQPLATNIQPTISLPVGTHTFTLRVTDDVGATDDDAIVITVLVGQPYFEASEATNASDQNPGTEAMPFKTIQRAADIARPGDVILLRGGTYTETYIRFANSGQPGAPITVQGYGAEEVVLTTGSQAKWFFDFTDWFVTDMEGFGHYVFRNFKAHGSRHIWRLAFFGDGSRARPHHITIEDVVAWDCGSVLAARNGGVEYITIRRCDLSGCLGTEGSLDFSNNKDDLDTPQSGSHDILIEDCDFHDNNASQQINGIVTQGAVYNVTLRRCRSWNNGKYGFALKGSGNFVVDRCASWANGSSQFYLRGMIATDPPSRTVTAPNDLLLTNCIAIGPRDSGGAVVIWREGSNIRMYNCTIVSLRDVTLTNSGGPFANNERQTPPILPIRADVRNCIIVTHDGTALRFFQGNGFSFIQNRRYEGDHNLFYRLGGGSQTSFKYQGNNWPSIDSWKAYWAVGEPNGDDMLNGPIATQADANSQWADPQFVFIEQNQLVPLAKNWTEDFRQVIDVAPGGNSPLRGAGENLSNLGVPQLLENYDGTPRPTTGPWTIGAM